MTGYFLDSYDEARARFRRHAGELASGRHGADVGAFLVPSATDDDLTIDYLYLPARAAPRKLVVFTSGVHGVEGFVGSAVQDMLMRRWLPSASTDTTSLLFVHSLNPWGYRHRRRVTEDNIDLNRNLSADPALFGTPNEDYRKLDAFLNPTRPVSAWDDVTDFVELAGEVLRRGPTALRDATLVGQYELPKGIYFGGRGPVPQKAFLEDLFRRTAEPHEAVFLMDLHTGYGARGVLHFFGDAGERSGAAMKKVFAGYAIDSAETNPDFYAIRGDLVVWLGQILPAGTTYIGTALEYGTLDSQTLLGGARSLQRSRLENQGFHHGYASDRVRRCVQRRFDAMFNPPDPTWRRTILDTTARAVATLYDRFREL